MAQWALHLHGVNRQGAPITCGAHVPPALASPGLYWQEKPQTLALFFFTGSFAPLGSEQIEGLRLCVQLALLLMHACGCAYAGQPAISLGCFHSLQRCSPHSLALLDA